ncbi:MAG: Flp family type IVb pilin [Vampirovibrionales bacterium]
MSRYSKHLGQSLVEYALILALVSIACIGALTNVGTSTSNKLGDVASAMAPVNVGSAGMGAEADYMEAPPSDR